MKKPIHTLKERDLTNKELNTLENLFSFFVKIEFLEECKDNKELLILRGHLAVEYFLNKAIEKFLINGRKLTCDNNFSFSKKLLIVECFNVLEKDTYKFIKELNKLRNKCSHQIGYRVSNADINELAKILPLEIFDNLKEKDNNKKLFNLLSSVLTNMMDRVNLIQKND